MGRGSNKERRGDYLGRCDILLFTSLRAFALALQPLRTLPRMPVDVRRPAKIAKMHGHTGWLHASFTYCHHQLRLDHLQSSNYLEIQSLRPLQSRFHSARHCMWVTQRCLDVKLIVQSWGLSLLGSSSYFRFLQGLYFGTASAAAVSAPQPTGTEHKRNGIEFCSSHLACC